MLGVSEQELRVAHAGVAGDVIRHNACRIRCGWICARMPARAATSITSVRSACARRRALASARAAVAIHRRVAEALRRAARTRRALPTNESRPRSAPSSLMIGTPRLPATFRDVRRHVHEARTLEVLSVQAPELRATKARADPKIGSPVARGACRPWQQDRPHFRRASSGRRSSAASWARRRLARRVVLAMPLLHRPVVEAHEHATGSNTLGVRIRPAAKRALDVRTTDICRVAVPDIVEVHKGRVDRYDRSVALDRMRP